MEVTTSPQLLKTGKPHSRASGMLWILPLATAIWILASFIITYTIAVVSKDVDLFLPYISYTAIKEPQKSVFSQFVNIGAILLGLTACVRFLQVKACYIDITPCERRLNRAGLVLGLLSALGLSMVANFQAKLLKFPHYLGAFMAFAIGTVYCWVQSFLTRRATSLCIYRTRFGTSITISAVLFIFVSTMIFYKTNKFPGSKYSIHKGVYLTSTCSEWLLAIMVLVFVLTFMHDFRSMKFQPPNLYIRPTNRDTNHSTTPTTEENQV
ncbi:DNA damage-regulated autophagy modulator protein 1-like [Argonauta hians]